MLSLLLSLPYTILEGYNEVDTILLNVGLQFTFPLWWIAFRLGNELRYIYIYIFFKDIYLFVITHFFLCALCFSFQMYSWYLMSLCAFFLPWILYIHCATRHLFNI